jgi:hypothetical protein
MKNKICAIPVQMIVKKWLEANGYNGLERNNPICDCLIYDLDFMGCPECPTIHNFLCRDCKPFLAKKRPGMPKEK